MDLGTGIFLSSVVLAVVFVYAITKDRWRWRRIIKRTAFICLGLIILGAALGIGAYYWDQLPQKVGRQTEYAGLRLGMTQDEVMYVKGYPPSVLAEEVQDPQWKGFYTVVDTKKLEKGKRVIDYRHWSYEQGKHNINVTFNAARTAVVHLQCFSDDRLYRCPLIGGIRDGDSEKEVVRKLGNPTASKIDGVAKTLTYRDLGIEFILTKEQVYMMSISDQQHRE